jgi:hypothetical protein
MNIPRKRSGSNGKKTKEKFEALFRNEESEEIAENLLTEIVESKIVFDSFELEISKIDIDKSAVVRRNLNVFIKQCIKSLNTGECVGDPVKVGRL